MHNPPHPAAILREDVLPKLKLSIGEAAKQLGVARVTLSRLLNEHSDISVEMAIRLELWLGKENGSNAANWLAMQATYDLWRVRGNFSKVGKTVVKAKCEQR